MGFSYPPPERHLSPTERRVLRSRKQHWVVLVPNIAFTVATVGTLYGLSMLLIAAGERGGIVQSVLWYMAVGAVVQLAVKTADWWDDVLILTDERVLNVTGLIASRAKDTPVSKITDRDIKHTPLGNLLGYGHIFISAPGHAALQRLTFVPDPMTVYEAIVKLTSKAGLPPPAVGDEIVGGAPSVEELSAEWPVEE